MSKIEQLGDQEEGYAQNWTHPQNGQIYQGFNLPKDLTLTLVAGYNVKLRKRIIDRWMELEAKAAPTIPQTLPEALRLAAEAIEKSEKLALENKAQAEALAVAAPKVEALERISAYRSQPIELMNLTASLVT